MSLDLNFISAAAIASWCETIDEFLFMPLEDRQRTFESVCSWQRMVRPSLDSCRAHFTHGSVSAGTTVRNAAHRCTFSVSLLGRIIDVHAPGTPCIRFGSCSVSRNAADWSGEAMSWGVVSWASGTT